MPEARLLVVDDDLKLRTLLLRYLTEQGFSAQALPDAVQLDRLLGREPFDLLILDINLPGEDGLSICRRLRGMGNDIPILMLTARGDDVDRIVGLEIGADDYLPKPYNPRELLARVRALLRRRQSLAPGAPALLPGRLVFGPNRLDLASRELTHGGEPRVMTSGEFALLKALVAQPRIPLSREKLIALARGREHGAGDRSIDVQISRLRRLVEPDPATPRYIQTVWGVGYVFVPDSEEA
jgi:two-component system phosphate regulon response regulator OmpR